MSLLSQALISLLASSESAFPLLLCTYSVLALMPTRGAFLVIQHLQTEWIRETYAVPVSRGASDGG